MKQAALVMCFLVGLMAMVCSFLAPHVPGGLAASALAFGLLAIAVKS